MAKADSRKRKPEVERTRDKCDMTRLLPCVEGNFALTRTLPFERAALCNLDLQNIDKSMSEPERRGSKKKKGASQHHFRQGTLFDHFLVTRERTPAPTPSDSNGIDGHLGSSGVQEPSFVEHFGDIDRIGSYFDSLSSQSTADTEIDRRSSEREHLPPHDTNGATNSSSADFSLIAGSYFPDSWPCSSVSSPGPSHGDTSRVIDLTIEEGTEKEPILIAGSPVCECPSLNLVASSHTPLQPLLKRKQLKNCSFPGAPFPDASTQHVRDSVMRAQVRPIGLPRRQPGKKQCFLDADAPRGLLKQTSGVDAIPSRHTRFYRCRRLLRHQGDPITVLNGHDDLHPAVSSISGLALELRDIKETSQQHWGQKWRPRQAEHVLGNERNACYLREWMHALRLHFDTTSPSSSKKTKSKRGHKKRKRGEQRPEVVREVTRKRQRAGDLNGWMVDDDDDMNEEYDGCDDFSDLSLPSSWNPRDPQPISFGKKIHNAILLAGPPGCGKTAAIYACAEELNWNVFEVYPGSGKRGGTHLDNLIGDVGRNHTLPQPLLFRRGRSEPPSPVKKPLSNTVDASNRLIEAENHPQSVVLIEEADVVFADEAGFWPSVVAFIKECRRPVIITCNDVSLIPVDVLPLQTTLIFSLPPASLTRSLMSAICQVEGRATTELELLPCSEGDDSTADLRQYISQCQLGLTDFGGQPPGQRVDTIVDVIFSLRVTLEEPTITEPESDERRNLYALQQSLGGADLASYLDACVLHSQLYDVEVAEDHPDDQVGFKALTVSQRIGMPVHPDYYYLDVDVAKAVLRALEGLLERCFPSRHLDETCETETRPWPSREEYRKRLWEGLKTEPTLESMVDLPRLYLDYRPLIGMMVTVEDEEMEKVKAKAMERGKRGIGRLTQNSQKREGCDDVSVRWLKTREELREALRVTSTWHWH
ncbi:hypothetical protein B0F90DRAFT_553119 [Multifurca ochricompacta]|uniref:AAA+ ATPase domain-containing protein n=1 Tax=Multifurca ochricompacta TaxID=376703 RepID=A0AAD4MBH0_9AGAM|nr:hypothetical protein B0F90DRAFT_553119 [Multifurca ochricompacta]